MGITPNEILEKEFKPRLRGYDSSEVRAFLEEVAAELTAVIKERNTLKGYVIGCKAKLEEFKKKEEDFMSAIATAHRLAEDMKTQSAKDADLIMERAKMDAERIVADAHKEAVQLEERIRGLKRTQRETIFKIRSLIEGYLKLLDEEALSPQEMDDVSSAVTPQAQQSVQTPDVPSGGLLDDIWPVKDHDVSYSEEGGLASSGIDLLLKKDG
ncbi:MAG: DivIVA domain-containing protein [Desulfobacteraceae bacterium]|nr:DivIVA domain-containing protein [Desulfobacteraceae bacterium]